MGARGLAQGNSHRTAIPEITIPVVVHIVSPDPAAISDQLVQSQIDALNRDFNAENADLKRVPAYFQSRIANCHIRFVLAKSDPAGQASSGIVRVKTGIDYFNVDDRVKFTARGGDDAWPRDHYLNIWVAKMTMGISGYTSKTTDPPQVDGIVLDYRVFGSGTRHPEHGLGRIAVHEAGHWLGLKHIWGDAYCGDDGIDDTPRQKSYHLGCPNSQVFSCSDTETGDMYMNYMDRTNDQCMYMFTTGQQNRMRSIFEAGQLRHPLLSSKGLSTTGEVIDPNWDKSQAAINQPALALSCYPVPATQQLQVVLKGSKLAATGQLRVYNMVGQPVLTANMVSSPAVLDVSRLPRGQYIIRNTEPGIRPVSFTKL